MNPSPQGEGVSSFTHLAVGGGEPYPPQGEGVSSFTHFAVGGGGK